MKFTKITNSSDNGTLKPYFQGWLKERYQDCFAQISVTTTLKLKNAVKDVARALLGSVPVEIEEWCKRFEMPPQGVEDIKFILGYDNDEGHHQGSIERDEALKAYVNKYPDQWNIVKNALALPRQMGKHASAFVLASKPISDFIPLTTVGDVKVTAFSGPEVEAVGGLKLDWLVVNALNDIQGCLSLLNKGSTTNNNKGIPTHRCVKNPVDNEYYDIWDLPQNFAVFEDVSKGKTETVFQFNTHGAVRWLKNFDYKRPDGTPGINSVESMAVFTALDRPGPLNYYVTNPENSNQKHNIMVEYARRIRGLPGSKDILPIFDELLPETNSLIVFQEQLQKIYQNLTGCTGPEAEEFRGNVAKRKKEKVDAAYKFFTEKASVKLGVENANAVWQGLVTFAEYGFNKSHSISYCVISYACAWLKHYYPLEWWCAVLTNATKEEISTKFWPYVSHLIDLPDLNLSKFTWTIVDGRIRAPINLCYGIGETAHKQLCKYAPYTSLDDFCEKIVQYRVDNSENDTWGRSAITAGTIYTMATAGIMDSLFDPSTTIAERIDLYDKTLKKYVTAKGKKHSRIKSNYTTPDILGRYQLKKDILHVYSEDVRTDLLLQFNCVSKEFDSYYYTYLGWNRVLKQETPQSTKIVGLEELLDMDNAEELPQNGFKCAIIGYVEDQTTFQYQGNKTARKFLIDACGFKQYMVRWPSDFEVDREISTGSIIIGVIVKVKLGQGWAFRKLEILRSPVNKKETNND
jgi:DNA polymerase III alpha subunit